MYKLASAGITEKSQSDARRPRSSTITWRYSGSLNGPILLRSPDGYDQRVPESPVDFSGVHLKLARAGVHLDALRAEVETFHARDPVGFRHTTEPGDEGAEVHRL